MGRRREGEGAGKEYLRKGDVEMGKDRVGEQESDILSCKHFKKQRN